MRKINNPELFHFNTSEKTDNEIISGTPHLALNYSASSNQWLYQFDKSNQDDLLISIMNGLCSMIDGQSPLSPRVRKIQIREVENFLRDDNNQPVFELTQSLDDLLKNCLDRWAIRGFFLLLKENSEKITQIWPQNLVSQIQLLKNILDEEVIPQLRKENLNLDFIALEGHTVVFKLNRAEDYILLEGLKLFLNEKIEKVSLNIVAEE